VLTVPLATRARLTFLAGIAVLISMLLVLWIALPLWASSWVLEVSPFVIPAARAAVASGNEAAFAKRIAAWPGDAVPGLCSCLRHPQVRVRRLACEVLVSQAQHGPLDPRLIAALNVAAGDSDERVHILAKHALHPQPLRSSAGQQALTLAPAPGTVVPKADDDDDDEDDDEEAMPGMAPTTVPRPHLHPDASAHRPAASP
jgi:hypothetical protein